MKIPIEDHLEKPLFMLYPSIGAPYKAREAGYVGSKPLIGYRVMHHIGVTLTDAGMRNYAFLTSDSIVTPRKMYE